MSAARIWPVLWITGLAGAGKTRVAKQVIEKLRAEYANVIHVDGDAVRELFGQELGHSQADRLVNAYNISKLCHFLNQQGQIVICSTMSLYPEIWRWNREHIKLYTQIYLRVDRIILEKRNKKSLYSAETPGTDVVGRELNFNEPVDSDLILDNSEEAALQRNVQQILELSRKLILKAAKIESAKPLIGVPCRLLNGTDAQTFFGAQRPYVDALIAAGGAPLLIPLGLDLDALRKLYQISDGIMLMGGEDIDPVHYGETNDQNFSKVNAERDAAELQIARWAVSDKKPLLGICRGLQVLNVALGGSLYQDLEHDCKVGAIHRSAANDAMHEMKLEPGSKLAKMLGSTNLIVNSSHHQAVKELAGALKIVGSSADGVVEAVEGPADQFLVAVQCHPERMLQDKQANWQKVFEAFVQAIY